MAMKMWSHDAPRRTDLVLCLRCSPSVIRTLQWQT
jgi:hypothetical protein